MLVLPVSGSNLIPFLRLCCSSERIAKRFLRGISALLVFGFTLVLKFLGKDHLFVSFTDLVMSISFIGSKMHRALGNCSISSFSKQDSKCSLILLWSNITVDGSSLDASSIANASAKIPQS